MNFKKALCWSSALHLFIAIILFTLFSSRSEDYINITTVNLIDIPSYAAETNNTQKDTADINATPKKTIIQQFAIPDNSKTQDGTTKLQSASQNNKTASGHSKPSSPQIQAIYQNKPEKQSETILLDSEPRLKFMAPVNYYAQNGGICTFKILVSEEGKPLRIELEEESNNPDLDTAVKNALKHSEYIPAIVDGVPSQSWFTFSYQHWNISNETDPHH